MNELKEEYVVKCVEKFPLKKGYVAVTLAPTTKIQEDKPEQIQMGVFPKGMEPPKEVMQSLQMMVDQTRQMKRRDQHEYRDIILIISEIDYYATDWNFGDIVVGNFKKTEDGEKIPPDGKSLETF